MEEIRTDTREGNPKTPNSPNKPPGVKERKKWDDISIEKKKENMLEELRELRDSLRNSLRESEKETQKRVSDSGKKWKT